MPVQKAEQCLLQTKRHSATQTSDEIPVQEKDADTSEKTHKAALQGADGGDWSVCTHLKTYGMNFDVGLGNALVALLQHVHGKTTLEFGAGLGLYTSLLAMKVQGMTDAVALEPSRMELSGYGVKASPMRQLTTDIVSATPEQLDSQRLSQRFDIVFSIEVMEHVPRELHGKAFDTLVSRVGKLMVFGAARPGQVGTGHIACRPKEEFKEELEKRGLKFLPKITESLQAAALPPNHNVNTMVFSVDQNFEDVPPAALQAVKRARDKAEKDEFARRTWPKVHQLIDDIKAGTSTFCQDRTGS
jgi:hypothetical protein